MTSVPAVRLATGYAAVAATVPYLTLKVLWLCGGTVGMDAVAVVIALALTHVWGRRIRAWIVLLPMWIATRFLAPIVVIVHCAPLAFGGAPAGSGPLRGWVYLFVYGGFAAQGLLLSAAFVLYARDRWAGLLAARNGDAASGPTRPLQALLTVVAAPLAAAVGTLHLAWALGASMGLPDAFLSDPPVAYRLTNGVYAAFAFAAVVGLPMLVRRSPRGGRFWVPLALTWTGAGSMLAWGLWQTATMAASPDLGTPLLGLATQAKVLAAVLAAVVVARLLPERPRFGRAG